MADISNKELLLPYGTVKDMNKRANAYKNSKKQKTSPLNKIYIVKGGKDYVTLTRLNDMNNRINKWNLEHKDEVLKNVWIKKPKTTTNVLKPSSATTTVPTVNIKGKTYKPKNMTEFYNLMGSFGYAYYYNDIYSLAQEISRLTLGKAMNCTDFSQFGVYVASQFKKDGKKVYQTRYAHINCRKSGGHVIFQIKGGEFGNKWTAIDIAAKADKDARVYPIGDYWCKDGTIRSYNELWVLSDDGKT
ncbi:MAG: hypothetical protein LBM02_09440 [Lachnospiraceae bacterium]|nr:hypothetical protein [Lachnospiraceae bacterium]